MNFLMAIEFMHKSCFNNFLMEYGLINLNSDVYCPKSFLS